MKKTNFRDIAVCLFLLCALCALIMYPQQSVEAAKSGVTLCWQVIVPSLFPFFVVSTLSVELGAAAKLGKILEPVMRPLFNVSGACSAALILGFVGGYPVGAKTAVSLYQNGSCTKEEAERMLGWCNNSGPAFILGVVGAGIFSSSHVGIMLYLAHALASIGIGVMFAFFSRLKKQSNKKISISLRSRSPNATKPVSFVSALVESIKTSFASSMSICGFVIFFTVIIRLLFICGVIPFLAKIIASIGAPVGMNEAFAEKLLTGVVELSSGVWSLKDGGNLTGSIAMAAWMLGWAGLSVHFQVLSFIGESGLKVHWYIIGKVLHSIASALLIFPLANVFLPDSPVSAVLAHRIDIMTSAEAAYRLLFAAPAVIVFISVLLTFFLSRRKKYGKIRTKGV